MNMKLKHIILLIIGACCLLVVAIAFDHPQKTGHLPKNTDSTPIAPGIYYVDSKGKMTLVHAEAGPRLPKGYSLLNDGTNAWALSGPDGLVRPLIWPDPKEAIYYAWRRATNDDYLRVQRELDIWNTHQWSKSPEP